MVAASVFIKSDEDEHNADDDCHKRQPAEPRVGDVVWEDTDAAWLGDCNTLPVVE